MEKFKELGLSESTLTALEAKGFEEPSPIQTQTIPLLLEGEVDVIGQAQTGTGKTAAFGLPIIEKISTAGRNVKAIILAPTRELAIQVADELNSLKGRRRINILPIYGGQSIERQIASLRKGIDVVVGTPGRVQDHINRKTMKLDSIEFFVLDEADEMLNMGFVEDIEKILAATNEDKRMLFFSATMPDPILKLAKTFMRENFKVVSVKKQQLTTNLTDQIYFELRRHDKFEALCRIVDIEPEFYGVVFCRTKNDVDEVSQHLSERGYEADGLHGDISQHQRERILTRFRKKIIKILVATDVAARGIDIQDLTHVVNYSLPQDPESYVHRIGRTGRAGKEGTAITFITPSEYRKLAFIKRIAKANIRKETPPKVRDIIRAKKARIIEDVRKIMENEDLSDLEGVAKGILEDAEPMLAVEALIKYAFQDELNKENYNDIKLSLRERERDGGRSDRRSDRGGRGDRRSDRGERRGGGRDNCRLFVALGKKDGMTKRKLVDFIEQETNVPTSLIQQVEVIDAFSFISVPFPEAETILKVFRSKKGRGQKSLIEKAKGSK
ncbi:MAG: DEAD/DEAH box helicase [Flammeovirgaceae bacterium]